MIDPPRDITGAVRAELAVPGRYHLQSIHAHRSLIMEAIAWLWARLTAIWNGLMRHVHVGRGGLAIAGDVMIVACVLAVGGIAAHLLLRLQLDRTRSGRSEPLASGRTAQSYAVAAAQAASSGDFVRAVRLLFIAAVTLLDLRGILHAERGATVNDLRRALAARDATLEEPFADIARLYTNAAYAERPLGPQAWARAQAAYARLKERSIT